MVNMNFMNLDVHALTIYVVPGHASVTLNAILIIAYSSCEPDAANKLSFPPTQGGSI